MNYYEILGLKKNCKKKAIKNAYKKLAIKYHPDKGGDIDKFKKIAKAYTVLYDDEKRIKYDNNNILESFDLYSNPFDIFEEIINRSDIVYLKSQKNNWLYNDFDIEDNIKESVFLIKS